MKRFVSLCARIAEIHLHGIALSWRRGVTIARFRIVFIVDMIVGYGISAREYIYVRSAGLSAGMFALSPRTFVFSAELSFRSITASASLRPNRE